MRVIGMEHKPIKIKKVETPKKEEIKEEKEKKVEEPKETFKKEN